MESVGHKVRTFELYTAHTGKVTAAQMETTLWTLKISDRVYISANRYTNIRKSTLLSNQEAPDSSSQPGQACAAESLSFFADFCSQVPLDQSTAWTTLPSTELEARFILAL